MEHKGQSLKLVLLKEQKRVLMFAKESMEKVSSTEFQRAEKEQKRNSEVCETEC